MSKKPSGIFQERSLFNNVRRSSLLRSTMLLTTMLPTLLYANEGVDALSTVRMKAEMAVASSSDVKIKGNVKDETGEPLIGVSVTVQGATIGTVTDYDGNFELSVPANSQLVFSYIGYTSQTVKVSGNKALNITMKEDSKALDEVVVVGFGSQKKVNVTGAITQVNADQLKERPVQNVSQALQGVVPGLNLSSSSGGELNGSMNINIRGGGTIGDGSKSSPLVLIDGVEGNMNSINPQDIESISVLKDAASAAVYGSRAPFGVILITTKKGTAGRTTINYNNNFRFSSPIGLPNMLDSYRFAQYFNRASQNGGGQPIFDDKMMGLIQDFQNGVAEGTGTILTNNNRWGEYGYGYANTDWFDVHYKDHSFSQEHNLSVNGGSDKVQYLVSGNFMNSNGILTYSDDTFDRYSINAKINAKITDNMNMTYGGRWVRETYDRASYQTGLFYHNIARRWPTNAVYDPNGNIMEGSEILQLQNGGRDKSEKDWVYQQLRLDYEPIKDWKIIAEGNLRTMNNATHWDVLPVQAFDGDNNAYYMAWNGDYAPGMSRVNEGSTRENFYTTNIFSEYSKDINGNFFKVMLGFNAELFQSRYMSAQRDGLITSNLPEVSVGTTNQRSSGGRAHWSTAGFFGRINYNYKERYMAEVNARYDGTSRFVGDKRWNIFPSFSAGWNIAREEFWEDKLDYLSTFKLRGSWGELGNQNTESLYPFYQTLPFGVTNGGWLVDGLKPNTAGVPGLVSTAMTWERVRSWNIGLDVAALNNRLTASFDYFNRKTLDMIGPAPELPDILGTSVPKVNNCDLESKGFEMEIAWRDRIGEVGYGVRGVLSDSRQKVTRFPNATNSISTYYAGRLFGEIWGYETIGIAKSQEEMDAHLAHTNQNALGSNWGAGDIMYKDLNGDGKIDGGAGTLDNKGDKKIIGNSTPRFNFGLTLDAQWKGFDISLFFQGVGKRDYAVGGPYFWGANGGQWQSTAFEEHWDFFRPEGDPLGANLDSYYPRPLFGGEGKNQQTQTKYLQNAAYVRLKNAQIGYTFPSEWMSKAKIQSLRLFVSGDNLFTISSMSKIFDPEAIGGGWGDGKLYPLARVISFGLNVNF